MAAKKAKTNIHSSIIFRIKVAALARKNSIPKVLRCEKCHGFGVDEEKFKTLSLNRQFYDCPYCNGSGVGKS